MTDRYKKIDQIGEDILGNVHLADDTMLQRRVTLRHINCVDTEETRNRDDSWRKEFAEKAGMLGAMQHPNMVTIYDINVDDDGANVVSQYVEGQTLAERLAEGPLAQTGVHRMASDMLEVLHAAHDSGVFHGALHTGSITRVHRASGGHRYLLMDLGLNQLASMVRAERVKIADPVLMAPELHNLENRADAKADLFMLGQLCYTALVGGHPLSEKSSQECLDTYLNEGMPPLEDYVDGVDPTFAAWVMNMVESDPEKRPADTAEAMVQLHAIQLSEPEPNVPGETHAIVGGPELVTTTQALTATNANTVAATDGALTGAQHVNAGATVESEKKEKLIMNCVIGGLAAVLVIGGLVLALRGGDDDDYSSGNEANTSSGNQDSNTGGSALNLPQDELRIDSEEMVNTVIEQENPEIINLDENGILNWFIGSEIPIASKNAQKSQSSYVISVEPLVVKEEFLMGNNPVHYSAGGSVYVPKAAVFTNSEENSGAGYKVELKIPEQESQSITANVYLMQKSCDVEVKVSNSATGSEESLEIFYNLQGVVRIPVEIDNPTPGGTYTIEISASSTSKTGQYMVGLNGIVIEAR